LKARIGMSALLIGVLFVASGLQPAMCSSSTKDTAATVLSDSVTPLVIGSELALMVDGPNGKHEAVQGAKALAATGFATECLKLIVREKRPTGSSLTGFPSGHTSEAFAMATVLGDYHPKYAFLAYTTAAAIGWSRVAQDKHGWQDVIAGALLGHFIARHYAQKNVYAGPGGVGVQYKF
jgi:membrane-associated phospholipid phosphatase